MIKKILMLCAMLLLAGCFEAANKTNSVHPEVANTKDAVHVEVLPQLKTVEGKIDKLSLDVKASLTATADLKGEVSGFHSEVKANRDVNSNWFSGSGGLITVITLVLILAGCALLALVFYLLAKGGHVMEERKALKMQMKG